MWRIILAGSVLSGCPQGSAPDELAVWSPSDHAQPANQGTGDGRAQPGRPGAMSDEESVALLWVEACASCHGPSGAGDGPGAPEDVELQDLTDPEWQDQVDDEAIAAVIREGRGAMPAYGPTAPGDRRLNERGIAALVGHIRRLRQAAP